MSPYRVWKIKENIEINHEYAERLHEALKNYFPELDFELIIVNRFNEPGYVIEERPANGPMMVRIDGTIESYKDFYSELLMFKEN